MKKKLSFITAAVMLSAILSGCGSTDSDTDSDAVTEAVTEQTTTVTTAATTALDPGWEAAYDGCNMRIEGASKTFRVGSNGFENIAIIKFKFKNKSKEVKYFDGVFQVDVKQHGKSCENISLGEDDFEGKYDTSTSYADVKPGTEYSLCKAYVLNDGDQITINITGYGDSSGKVLTVKRIGEPQN